MAKISEVIASIIGPDFDPINVQSLADNLDSVVQKLNTTYQQQLTDEYEAYTSPSCMYIQPESSHSPGFSCTGVSHL